MSRSALVRLAPWITVFLWGSAFITTPLALRVLEPIDVVLGRFLVAAVPFALVAVLSGRRVRSLRAQDVSRLLLGAVLGVPVYHLGFAYAAQQLPATTLGLLAQLTGLFGWLIAVAGGGEPARRRSVLGVLLATAGAALAILARPGGVDQVSPGPSLWWLGLLPPIALALYGWATQPLAMRYGGLTSTAWVLLLGTLMLIPWLLVDTGPVIRLAQLGIVDWWPLVALGLASTFLAYVLWGVALSGLRSAEVTSVTLAVPVVVAGLAAWSLGERPGLALVAALPLLAVGLRLLRAP